MINVAINGFGRIGRMILRALYEGPHKDKIKIVAINDLGTPEANAHLLRYDSTHGRFPGNIISDGNCMEVKVDVVYECTGIFTSKEKASAHLEAGAKKVIISAPGEKDIDATIVFGVNHTLLKPEHTVISNASCTTNCLAPVAKIAHENIGIKTGLMTTVHAYTNDQALLDMFHKDLRRARSATQSM